MFRSKLQSLLILRQRTEQAALENYGRALLARTQAMDNLNAVETRLALSWNEWRHLLSEGCAAEEAAHAQAFHRSLEERKRRCEATLADAELAVNQALQTILAARQQREAVENYLADQRAQYDRALQREEQKLMDDLVNRRVLPALAWRADSQVAWN